jgi:phosphonate transport system substrate-binding protein
MNAQRARLIVPSQDDAGHLAGWYLLNVHLQRSLDLTLKVEPAPEDEAFAQLFGQPGLIVHANAYNTLRGMREAGWRPVARPVQVFEQLLVLARRGTARPARHPVRVACASEASSLPRLGADTLEQQGLLADDCEIHACGSDQRALNSLLQGDSDLALLEARAWSGLGPSLRDQLYRVTESHSHRCFSSVCISPDLAHLESPLRDLLTCLPQHSTGETLLTDLGYPGFEAVPAEALQQLESWLREPVAA